MKDTLLRRFMTLFLVMVVALFALTACGADEEDEGIVEDEGTVLEDEDLVEEEPLAADEEPLDEVDEGLGEDEDLVTEEEALTTEAALIESGLMTADQFIGLEAVNELDEPVAEVVDAFFDIDGNIRYVVVDLDEEIEVETFTDDDVLDASELEELDVVMVDWDLLEVRSGVGDLEDEAAEVSISEPLRLVFLEDIAAEGIPGVSQEIDAAALADQALFVDPTAFGIDDGFGTNELLQLSSFEYFDLSDHDVVNLNGEELGDIDELIVDFLNGQVAYAIVDVGGFLGLGENTIAIAWSQFLYETTDQNFVLDVTTDELTAAPLFEEDLETGFFQEDIFAEEQEFFATDPFLAEEPLAVEDEDVVVLSFNELDVNADQVIDEVEFERYANEVGIDPALFADFDENGDGLDQAEFNALREAQGLPIPEGDILPEDVDVTDDTDVVEDEADLADAEVFDFSVYDADADLSLDQDEFGAFATEAGIDEGLFDTYDEDGDELLDESEFNALLGDEGLVASAATPGQSLLTTDRFIGMELVSGTQAAGFTAYDLDADGFLDENEFNAYLTDFGVTDTGQFDDYDLDDDNLLNTDEFNTFVQDEGLAADATAAELGEVTLGTVVDGFFNIDGDMPYVVIDVEEEAVVQIETLVGDDTLFDEEVDTILMSYNLLNVSTDPDFDDEVATADIETPTRLLLLDNFGQDVPWVAQEIDAAALEGEQLSLDPARFNVQDEDFLAAAEQDLLQLSHFEYFDLADHEVVNMAGEDLGEIDELVVDIVEGRVAYAVVETGGFLGIGDSHTVIPWSQFVYETADQDFVLDVDAATLEAAPTITDEDLDTGIFDADVWETDYNSYWDSEL